MKSEYVAAIFNEETKELIMVVDVENDIFLNDPAYMMGPERRKKVLIPRYINPLFEAGHMTALGVSYIQQNNEKFFNGDF